MAKPKRMEKNLAYWLFRSIHIHFLVIWVRSVLTTEQSLVGYKLAVYLVVLKLLKLNKL